MNVRFPEVEPAEREIRPELSSRPRLSLNSERVRGLNISAESRMVV